MELWSEIRRRVLVGELSMRQACSEYHLNFRTVRKVVRHAEPPLRAGQSRARPVLGPFLPVVQQIIDDDRHAPPKQRHSARRIYERLRDEHGYAGCPSIVRDAVRTSKQSQAEVFVPLLHPPGEGQVDFGRAEVVVAGMRHKAALFVLTLPFSNARFGCLFPRECTETFHEGHARAFAFFAGVPTRLSYDNSKIAVVKLTGPHERQLSREFLRLQSHFAFAAHFCRVRQAHEKGHVENGVGYVRRNFLVPVPQADSWDELNERLAAACRREFERTGGGRDRATAELLAADRAAFLPLPAEPFEARRLEPVVINSLSLGRLALLERKPGALDYARPLAGWSLPEVFPALRLRLEQADPKRGTRHSIRVLRLLETYDLAAVTAAVERALALAVSDADAVRLLVERARERPAAGFDLTGRPQLLAVHVPPPDLTAYSALTSAKEVKR